MKYFMKDVTARYANSNQSIYISQPLMVDFQDLSACLHDKTSGILKYEQTCIGETDNLINQQRERHFPLIYFCLHQQQIFIQTQTLHQMYEKSGVMFSFFRYNRCNFYGECSYIFQATRFCCRTICILRRCSHTCNICCSGA